ncbi:MAG: Uma2 family endonuclease [Deltaproteobacteria bacterium]|nr:Uma2 family endonuclease [Deltaproteobacteria bacterium]
MSQARRVLRAPATTADLLALAEDVAAEVVDGELVEKAAPSFEHGQTQFLICVHLGRFGGPPSGGGAAGWWIATEVDVEYEPRQVYRHDVVGWRRSRVPERPAGRPIRARPDWVCEILSASNASTDTVRKLRTLHRDQVPHYWIADPERRTLTVLRWATEGFLTIMTAEAGERARAEPFDEIELDVAGIFGEPA